MRFLPFASSCSSRSSFLPLLLLGAAIPASVVVAQPATFGDGFRADFEDVDVVAIPSPTDVNFSPDGQVMFVTQKEGSLWAVTDFHGENPRDSAKKKKVLDLEDIMCSNGERALGGVAVHPEFPEKPWVYIYYTYNKFDDCDESYNVDTGPVNRMSRFVWDTASETIDGSSEEVFFDTPRVPSKNHNSGGMGFGKDGYLYVTVGDGGGRSAENDLDVSFPQALDRLLGKVVRLTDEGEVPEDNPFTPASGHADSARCNEDGLAPRADVKCQEIFSVGHRNPWKLAMDPNAEVTHYFINEVGRATWEEINEGGADFKGANYGYPKREGPCEDGKDTNCVKPTDFEDPVHWYHHTDGGGCVTAGAFVPNWIGWPSPAFDGAYLYADFSHGEIRVVTPGGEACPHPECDPPISAFEPTEELFAAKDKVISMNFGRYGDSGGMALYYATRDSERGVRRIQFTGTSNRSPMAQIAADPTFGFSPLLVNFDGTGSEDPDGDDVTYEWYISEDGGEAPFSTSPKTWYEYTQPGTYYAKLVVKDGQGGVGETTVRIEVDNTPPVPQITSPEEGTTFAVGDALTLVGSATDEQDGTVPDASLSWEVRLFHRDHYHPFVDAMGGNSLEVVAPQPEWGFDATDNTHMEIMLTATDSSGLTMTTSRIVKPELVTLDVDTIPSGLAVEAYGEVIETPAEIVTWENHEFKLKALDQTFNGDAYSWVSWSDGGRRRHKYVASSSKPGLILATFQKANDEETGGSGQDTDGEGGADETSSVSTSIVELLDFDVSVEFEPSRRLRQLEDRALANPRGEYLDTAFTDHLSDYMVGEMNAILQASGLSYATLHKIRLTQKGDWTASNDDLTYDAKYGGVAIFLKENEDQGVPTKSLVQSMQVQALDGVNSELLSALPESNPEDNPEGHRIASVSANALGADEPVDKSSSDEEAPGGRLNTAAIVGIAAGSCLAFAAIGLIAGSLIHRRRRKDADQAVPEIDVDESPGSNGERNKGGSLSNTDSEDETPPSSPEKEDPESTKQKSTFGDKGFHL